MNIFEELKVRGLIFQTTDEAALVKALTENSVTFYTGYDPTADSLHLGHLVPILNMRRLQLAGHNPVALVGGATGMIGDPSFKDSERSLQTTETVANWSNSIKNQLSRFLSFEGDHAAKVVNNYDWFSSMNVLEFLRDIGKHFTINYMMSKESVKSRIETGISYTEFAYQILQGYDFYQLNENHGITLQIGGSDQWGNMVAGTDLIRKKSGNETHVITVPLITDSTGRKFGKSEGNAVWLDADKTSPYEFYQFWLNVADADAIKFLRIFTFLSLDDIDSLAKVFEAAPHERLAQKTLAKEVVSLVHGEAAYEQAVNISEQLFEGHIKALSVKDIKAGLKDVPNHTVTDDFDGNLVNLLVDAKISPSRRQAREDITNGAIYLNGERQTDLEYVLSDTDKLENELTVIRRGKKKYTIVNY
ncbi:tyrosyl-tRNA synthetase [Lactococcus piscium]|uniref:Tyrosine--tRNA ligase n=1 Tax=Pseudolactococcus carnosus TaxID=2749961 RepID=A0ABT0AV68_9LACT|nr:tyrosine--tRNA ligase [Lactococcus carnosus]MCJ1990582.1 tyrosine--tRNA ligase [Lactococcus carnosus]MCJ2000551.1 tyrosine--tRNA ligase [Lactococcus carnosus]MCJ2002121.1 tyrosine--tRNA ligase [Lactococcus carnosus]SOB48774.1 tyrosyl-tRNA synthetase [Lactococcus piscium]